MTTVIEKTTIRNARLTGLLYLIIIICGLFTEMFVRGTMVVAGDALTTVNNIKAGEGVFRIGFVSDLIMVIADIGVAVLFYLLLKPVNKTLSMLAAIFRLVQATIIAINLINHFAVILLINGTNPEFIQTQTMFYIEMHTYGYLISGVFFGLSCIVLGYLFSKSTLFPKILGYMIAIGGAGYLIDCFTNFLAPQYGDITEVIVLFTAVIAELATCLWLLVRGVKRR